MEFIYKTPSFWKLVYLKLGKKGIWQYSLKNKFKTLEKILKCNMPWMHDEILNIWKIWVVTVRFQDPVSSFPLNLKRGENLFRTSQDKLCASLSISKVFLAVYYINLQKLALNLLLIILNAKTIYELVWTYETLQKLVLHSPIEVSLILGLNVADKFIYLMCWHSSCLWLIWQLS
jgi:hypothetical protein